MQISRKFYNALKFPILAAMERYRLVWVSVVVASILAWVKIVPVLGLTFPSALLPLCLLFAMLIWLSPPVAAALFFLSNYYLGNLSILYYPQISFLAVLTVVVVIMLFYVRWMRGELRYFFHGLRRVWLALAGLALFFLIGYLRAIWQLHLIEIEQSHPQSLSLVFQESLRGSHTLSHYMLLSHWLSFLVIGALACMSYSEFKEFFHSFSLLFVVQLLSIPVLYYPEFFHNVYVKCELLGLGYAQVNRAHLGYMAALAGALTLTMSHDSSGLRQALLMAWWVVLSAAVILSGSRGPVIAWVLVTLFAVWRGWRTAKHSYIILFTVLLSAYVTSVAVGVSLIPCGTLNKFFEARYSVEARVAGARDLMASYIGQDTYKTVLFPSGERRMNAGDLIRYGAGETAFLNADREKIRVKPTHSEVGQDTWLFGKGFGGSLRSIDAAHGELRIHAGSLNLFLDLFIETGVVGLSFFIASIMVLSLGLKKALTSWPRHDSRLLITGLLSVAIVSLAKVSIAADTPGEDLVGLAIGLLIGAISIGATDSCRGTIHEVSPVSNA